VEVITGEEEARLTGLGTRHGLELGDRPFVAFDLGGGTTEFLFVRNRGETGAVKEILNFFHSSEMMARLSDLLEGTLLDILGVPLKI
jgi:exopolyphosphatase/guanosine-5'-triphosphate,3'-diphosphate pyrophosphatase